MLDNYGRLSVRTYTAGGALPVEGALVRIRGADEENRFIAYSLVTNDNGITPTVELPTQDRELSLTPDPELPPYSTYDIEVYAEGYERKLISGVPIFSGVYSLQPVSLFPASVDAESSNTTVDTIPESDLL